MLNELDIRQVGEKGFDPLSAFSKKNKFKKGVAVCSADLF